MKLVCPIVNAAGYWVYRSKSVLQYLVQTVCARRMECEYMTTNYQLKRNINWTYQTSLHPTDSPLHSYCAAFIFTSWTCVSLACALLVWQASFGTQTSRFFSVLCAGFSPLELPSSVLPMALSWTSFLSSTAMWLNRPRWRRSVVVVSTRFTAVPVLLSSQSGWEWTRFFFFCTQACLSSSLLASMTHRHTYPHPC